MKSNRSQTTGHNSQINIPWAKPHLFGNEKKLVIDAIDSTWISGGPYVDRLEKNFTDLNRAKYGLTTSNGTAALYLSLLALGITNGDEIIVPGFSFAGAANMIISLGGTPVYVDVCPDSWCIDPAEAEKSITNRTKAIIPIHTYGNMCDMDRLLDLAKKYDLLVVEDAAESAFSKVNERFAGTFGDTGCFSFQATKTVTTGEGGFIITNNEELSDKMRLIRDHGMRRSKNYWHEVVGHNFRLTNLQAALGCGQLENIEMIISEKKRIFTFYYDKLNGLDGITFQQYSKNVEPVMWTVAIKIDELFFSGDRNSMMSSLRDSGIETRPGFYPYREMPPYDAPHLQVSEDLSANVISLPSFIGLSDENINYICDEIKKCGK